MATGLSGDTPRDGVPRCRPRRGSSGRRGGGDAGGRWRRDPTSAYVAGAVCWPLPMLAVVATSRGMAQLSLLAWCGFGLMAMATGLLYLLPAPPRWSPSPWLAGLPSGTPSGVTRPLRLRAEIVARPTPAGRAERPAVDAGRGACQPRPDVGRWLPAELVHGDGLLSSDILDGLVQLEALANGANPSQPTG